MTLHKFANNDVNVFPVSKCKKVQYILFFNKRNNIIFYLKELMWNNKR